MFESVQNGNPWQELMSAVEGFLRVRVENGAADIISIVLFASSARVVCTAKPLLECANDLRAMLDYKGGGTSFGPAIRQAQSVFEHGPSEFLPFLMFMSDGCPTDGEEGEDEMKKLHAAFHAKGLKVNSTAFGAGANVSKLRTLAESGGGEFLEAADGVQLKDCFEQTAASLGHSF